MGFRNRLMDIPIPKSVSNAAIRTLCIFTPPTLFAILWKINILEKWKYEFAGGIVLSWSLAVAWRIVIGWRSEISQLYYQPIRISLVEQALILVLAALMLDQGLTLYACILAGMLYWMTAGLVLARRPTAPTPFDLSLLSVAFLVIFFAAFGVFVTVISVRGY
jgi:hypothetical protein